MPQRLKVCHIIPTLVHGGAEKQMALLAQNLDPERFEVEVVVLTHSGPYEQTLRDSGVGVHMINKRWKFDPFAYQRLAKVVQTLKPDIVHTWLFAGNSYGRLAASRAKVPVIVAGERCVDPWKSKWQLWIDRQQLSVTDCVATNTSAVTDFYQSKGLPTEKFKVIPNAVSAPTGPRLTREELCDRLNIPRRGRIVGAVGRLWQQKGYRDLIWAAELLRVAYQDVWIVIVGDGPDLAKLQHYRDLSGAQDAVKFVGHRNDASQLMSAFDVLWNGSLYEGQSNTILEAMALGIPVVASDIPGTRDIFQHNESGLLYRLGDVESLTRVTNELLRVDERRQAIGDAAAARVHEHFSLQRMVSSYEALYTELYERKRPTQ